jgi:putative transposase
MCTNPLESSYPQRHNIRLPDYNYGWQGAYFVTICTHDKQMIFGDIINGTMRLNPSGEVIDLIWKSIPQHYPEVKNDIFIVMPNHIHGVILIQNLRRAGPRPAPTKKHPLSEIVRAFKSYSSRKINELQNSPGTSVWQRSYYEHVIRSEADFARIGEYILYNAAKWETDPENPYASIKTTISPSDL